MLLSPWYTRRDLNWPAGLVHGQHLVSELAAIVPSKPSMGKLEKDERICILSISMVILKNNERRGRKNVTVPSSTWCDNWIQR